MDIHSLFSSDTIVSLGTSIGHGGALAIIRVSGPKSFVIVQSVFTGKDLESQKGQTIHFGHIKKGTELIDEVLVSVFKEPHSFTKENSVDISCHASPYIVEQILQLLLHAGARLARPGEFTQRALKNGRFDLAQAEAVADLIHSETAMAHRVAIQQIRGDFSAKIQKLRSSLIHFASLLELELDFSDEDVEFANRAKLKHLVQDIIENINPLIASFSWGNVVKKGVPIVITGKPNVGKSTLLNSLIGEEKALVSKIPGTTRDVIEERIRLEGVDVRFVDTAGMRKAQDPVEAMGIARAMQEIQKAHLILQVLDLSQESVQSIKDKFREFALEKTPYLVVGNKSDIGGEAVKKVCQQLGGIVISAQEKKGLKVLTKKIAQKIKNILPVKNTTIVVNARHYQALKATEKILQKVVQGLSKNQETVLLVFEIREALRHLGEITGEITTEDLLDSIFSKFCIGK